MLANKIIEQLEKMQVRARKASIDQFKEAEKLKRRHYFLGVPSICLSAIVGSTAFISASEGEITSKYVIFMIVGVSIIAAVLSSLMTFFGYNERAEKYRVTGGGYSNLRRKLEAEIAIAQTISDADTSTLADQLRLLTDNYGKITENAPLVGHNSAQDLSDANRSSES